MELKDVLVIVSMVISLLGVYIALRERVVKLEEKSKSDNTRLINLEITAKDQNSKNGELLEKINNCNVVLIEIKTVLKILVGDKYNK